MNVNDLSKPSSGKAANLLDLQQAGFPVPDLACSPVDLANTVRQLGTPLVVRSSASVEDGRSLSFAGQFETVLELNHLEEVEEAVRRCRLSVSRPSVIQYCRDHDIDPSSIQMDVIVQRMVRPELAGVAFTVNPVTGAEEVVIEACEGLADQLLAGRRASLPTDHPLVKEYAPRIEQLARAVQRHYGAPQDIEFAVEGGTLYLLQARPITRIHFLPETGEWTNADFRDGGVSSRVCTPLMWSLYDFIWEDALKGFFREVRLLRGDFRAGRMFFGRPYWNLGEVKRCLEKLPGFVEREFDKDLSVQIGYEGNGHQTPVNLWTLLRAIPIGWAIRSFFKNQQAIARRFLQSDFAALEEEFERVPSDVVAGLRRLIEHAYKRTETTYFRTIYAASIAKMDFLSSFPDADYATLVSGLPPLRHLEPTRVMRAMAARGDTDIAPLLKRFRHHGRSELDIRVPRWDQDPEFVQQLLAQFTTPTAKSEDPHAVYERARDAYLKSLPARKHKSFHRKVDRLRSFVWLREELRDLSSRMYYLIRRYVLAIAEQRELGDDIFFMTFGEILDDDRSNVRANREIYDSYRNFQAPNEIGSRFPLESLSNQATGGQTLHGIGASQGAVEGVAWVLRRVEDVTSVPADAVLICPFTDPGWTPILDRVIGVVTETGGLLSHAAVICREYGIPAVLGVSAATQRIRTGQRLCIDGSRGRINLLD